MSVVYESEKIYDLLESLKPLNFGRRFMFQKYLSNEISHNRIDKDDVEELKEDFLTDEFLYGNYIRFFEGRKDKFNNLFSGVEGNYDEIYERYIEEYKNKILKVEENNKELEKMCINSFNNILLLFGLYRICKMLF